MNQFFPVAQKRLWAYRPVWCAVRTPPAAINPTRNDGARSFSRRFTLLNGYFVFFWRHNSE